MQSKPTRDNPARFIRIRPWRAGDADLVRAAGAEISPLTIGRRFGVGGVALPRPYLEMLDRLPDDAGNFVALDGDRLVGWAESQPIGPGEIEAAGLVVDGWQGRGIGTLLGRAVLAEAVQAGNRLHLYVQPGNVAATRLIHAVAPPGFDVRFSDGYTHYVVGVQDPVVVN